MATNSRGPREVLRDYLVKNGLKTSRQRELIADTFFAAEGHLSVDELLDRVRAEDAGVGQATIYRTMKLLAKCGLAEARQFGDGHTRYEHILGKREHHHDHLICTSCGTIVEFVDAQIEALQTRVADAHGFTVVHHKMELYGTCSVCNAAARQP
ncbi:MAG: transcriptional repressor [Deltaproteobacteria bacterium]|nr:transcriptional repressor [Deltaproteobacteria bacterium]